MRQLKQPVKTPKVSDCAVCGSTASVVSWNFDFVYTVMCSRNHALGYECGSAHRAICKWNNRQNQIIKELQHA